jgi:hypothetical protein
MKPKETTPTFPYHTGEVAKKQHDRGNVDDLKEIPCALLVEAVPKHAYSYINPGLQ